MNIFIGGAWPYANGSLHIGHIAGLIAGDVLARYHRLKGDKVLYVSGSDCHGTPIAIRARQEGINPEDIANKYHKEIYDCFNKLGFSYDIYSRTDSDYHKNEVKNIFENIWKNAYLYTKQSEQCYCVKCQQFLPDRYVEGKCPNCGSEARGDQCDNCTTILSTVELTQKKCKLCNSEPIIKETEHLYFKLSELQNELQNYVNNSSGWRTNAIKYTQRYLSEGLKDRAVTRDIDYGISVPIKNFEHKKIYVWMEAVCGYLTASKQWAELNNRDYRQFWISNNVKAYYVHGKDNVPFHSLIWPALLLAEGELHLPDKIVSSEYLTLERKKISTSKNFAVWIPDLLKRYNPDSIRYFLLINGPEKRDADFSFREFVNSNNSELLGAFGNLVNRTLVFIKKSYNNIVPIGVIDEEFKGKLQKLYEEVGSFIEKLEFKQALELVFEHIRLANKYFDEQRPWITVKSEIEKCNNSIYTCVVIIANLASLLNPFIPFASQKVKDFLSLPELKWELTEPTDNIKLSELNILFERLDKSIIEYEVGKLGLNM